MLQLFSLYANDVELVFSFMAGFAALLIWHLPRYRPLAVFFLFQSVLMLLNITEAYHRQFTGIFLLTPVFTLGKGPLLYLFMRAMVNATPLRGWQLYRHLLPMLMALPLTIDPQFVVILGSMSQLAYLAVSLRLLQHYHTMARTFRADADELELRWVVTVFCLLATQVLISLMRLNMQPRLQHFPAIAMLWFSFDITFLFALCCFMLFKVLKQPRLYDDMVAYEQEQQRPTEDSKTRENAEAPHIFAGLETVIAGKQLYRQPRLTVEDIARETGLQMKDISWAINLGSGQNFNEYINRLRVAEVKQQLASAQVSATTLLELAFAAGFNSKSTFNAVFKREVGMTPTQFIKNLPPQ